MGLKVFPLRIYLDADGLLDLTTPGTLSDDESEEKISDALVAGG